MDPIWPKIFAVALSYGCRVKWWEYHPRGQQDVLINNIFLAMVMDVLADPV